MRINPPQTIADGASTLQVGEIAFSVFKHHVDRILTVNDNDLIKEMQFFGDVMKMVVEPTGCLGLAAARTCDLDLKGKKVGIVITGGNVDLINYAYLMGSQ